MAINPPKIYSCAEWGAKAPTSFSQKTKPIGVVIHHTTHPNRAPKPGKAEEEQVAFKMARNIQSEHMARRPAARDTLQNFTISRGGLILEGRHKSLEAAKAGKMIAGGHTRSGEANRSRHGIEVEGVYHIGDLQTNLSKVQIDALVELVAWLSYWGEFQSASIGPHRAFSATQCPGKLADIIDDLKVRVKARKEEIIAANGPMK